MTITPADLDALDQALAAMTPGPWKVCGANDGRCSCGLVWSLPVDNVVATVMVRGEWAGGDDGVCSRDDAAGIIALVNAAPALLAEVRRMRSDLDAALLAAGNARGVASDALAVAEGVCDGDASVFARERIAALRTRLASPDAEAAREAVDILVDLATYDGSSNGDAASEAKVDAARAAVLAMLGAGGER